MKRRRGRGLVDVMHARIRVSTFCLFLAALTSASPAIGQQHPDDAVVDEAPDVMEPPPPISGDPAVDDDPFDDPTPSPPPRADDEVDEHQGDDQQRPDDGYGADDIGDEGDDVGPTPRPDPVKAAYDDGLFLTQVAWGVGVNCALMLVPFGGWVGPFVGAYMISEEGKRRGLHEDWILPGLAGVGASMAVGAVLGGLIGAVGVVAMLALVVIGPGVLLGEAGFIALMAMYLGTLGVTFAALAATPVASGVASAMVYEMRAKPAPDAFRERRRRRRRGASTTPPAHAMRY